MPKLTRTITAVIRQGSNTSKSTACVPQGHVTCQLFQPTRDRIAIQHKSINTQLLMLPTYCCGRVPATLPSLVHHQKGDTKEKMCRSCVQLLEPGWCVNTYAELGVTRRIQSVRGRHHPNTNNTAASAACMYSSLSSPRNKPLRHSSSRSMRLFLRPLPRSTKVVQQSFDAIVQK